MIEEIRTLDDERISFYRNLKGEHPRLQARGVVLIEGEEQIRRAKVCGIRFLEAFFQEEERDSALLSGIPRVLLAPRELMTQIVGYRIHRGLFVLAERPRAPEHIELPALALNGISDPENVGTIARSALAFGFRSLIFDSTSSDPLSRRAIRVSMGAVFGLGIHQRDDLRRLREECSARCFAVETGGLSLRSFSFPKEFVLILGNEKVGVAPELLQSADATLSIPMEHGLLSSLNVAAAAAIVCAEAYAQRFCSASA